MPKKLKIAFIHPDLGIGGAERLVLDLAGALTLSGHEVRFLTNHFDPTHAFDELKNGDYPVEVYGDWLPKSVFGRFQALCAYVRMVYMSIVYLLFFKNKDKPDLYITDLIPVANVFLKIAGEKVIYYCHHPDLLASTPGGELKKFYRKPIDWVEMKTTGKADVILVNSEYTASIFRKTFSSIHKDIQILYPTIARSYQNTVENLREAKPIQELVPQIKKAADTIVFLSLNRFHPAKKLEFAILALAKLKNLVSKEDWEKIYLIIAGGYDPQFALNAITYLDLVNLTKEKQLEDKVIFLKSPNDNLKAELLKSCTCLLYTPVKEHFGIVPLEAMLVAKPVIAIDSGGPRETVEHGVTGYLSEPTGDSMAEFMSRIVSENVEEMGTKGKNRLEEKFSYTIFKNNLNSVVNNLMEDDINKIN
ncbi:alpha-1,3/1,6-mannosyltransferase ALG2 [Diabrotica virgifera virgifera]|uniref:Alpha-1,3/1,6-mannosyltransferase ALG2 n=1 Tax=Diabrotica virgifera virgifera TaxID=50390 RepID=A0A6P7GW74_DIAVI|nr:alpha-1,3/1,6-mannosyltransferase ALG2 [Diabrotica virgifera virgifera]